MKSHTPSSSMPVSAKFYARICDRIHSTISALRLPEASILEQQTLQLVNSYLLSSTGADSASQPTPAENTDFTCRIIFQTLKAEIDAAIERSRRARLRATNRRTLRQQPSPTPSPTPSATLAATTSSTPSATPSSMPCATPLAADAALSVNTDPRPTSASSKQSELSERSDLSELSERSERSEKSDQSESSDSTVLPARCPQPIPPSYRHRYGFRMRPVARPTRPARLTRRYRK